MKILLNTIKTNEADAIVVPVFSGTDKVVLKDYAHLLVQLKDKEKFKGEDGELFSTISGTQDIIFIGLGKEDALTGEKIRVALAKAVKKAREFKAKKIYVDFIISESICYGAIVKSMVEGLRFGDYKFDRYKTDKKEQADLEIGLGGVPDEKLKETEEYVKEANNIANATILARNLVNEPANVLYPETLAEEAKNYGSEFGFEVEVFDELQIDELEMDAFLSVAEGSDKSPRLIVMRYFGDEANKSEILGLVGKGLTYDSGGYSLKPTDGMVTMKCDMGGAAAVIGAISAIANQKLKINVVAVVAACENMISGGAYKPGDIIGSMAGKTIEVLNTDAEGRLTLVDAVHYIIEKEKVTKVIDVATLTGAALIALGTTTTAVVANNDEFYKELETASRKSGEKVWQLPAFEDYKKMLKSDIADLKNIGGRFAGTITAGLFIGEFVQNKPWLHLDIAGTAWTDAEKDYYSKGGTGAGVRTLYYLAKNTSKK
jgi:leucyl aminopeptidase